MTPRRSLLIVPLLTGFALAADPSPTTTPSATPSTKPTLEEERAAFKKTIEEEYSALPQKPDTTIGKILSIDIEDGLLAVQTKLTTTNGAVRMNATDWPGYLSVAVGDPALMAFSLKHVDVSRADWIATYTMVSTSIDYLQLNRDSESQSEMLSVTLIQSGPDEDEPVRLLVQHTYEDGRDAADSMEKYGAKTFEQLRHDHPRELRKYLLPILRDLGRGDLVRTSDARTAWQVLGADVPADPKIEKSLDAILPALASDDFAKRTSAQESLVALGPPGAAALSRRDLKPLGPDPRAAVDSFLNSSRTLSDADAEAMRKDADFLLDTLLLNDAALRHAAKARLEALTKTMIDLPDTLKPAELDARVEALRAKLAPSTQPTTRPSKEPTTAPAKG